MNTVKNMINAIENQRRKEDSMQMLDIMRKVTGVEPMVWDGGIIGFGMHHYKYDSGREGDTVAVGFAPRKTALVLYGVVYYDLNLAASKNLGPVTVGKGCLYVRSMAKINLPVLEDMIRKSFKARHTGAQ